MAEPSPTVRLLYPAPGESAVADAYADLRLGPPPAGRPYTIVNMVASVDGQGRVGRDTSALGGEVDLRLFVQLREQVDCVLAGTRTIDVEQYKGPASKESTRAARAARGLRPRPLLATVTRSGVVPWSAPAFQDEDLECVVFSDAELTLGEARARVTQVHGTDPRSVAAALARDFGVSILLLEGGPTLNTPFFAAGLVDELFLTVDPKLIGGAASFPIVAGDLDGAEGVPLSLIGVMLDDGDRLYLRYRVGSDGDRRDA